MKALVVGRTEQAEALASALRDEGFDSQLSATADEASRREPDAIAAHLVATETDLTAEQAVAVAVGVGDGPVALALTAAKLGVPLAIWGEPPEPGADPLGASEHRMLATLAGLELGTADEASAARSLREWTDAGAERAS